MARIAVPPEVRVWNFVDARGDCWEWTGYRNPLGYGQFTVAKYTKRIAHRYIYELLLGPLETGKELDHLCRNRGCVNPDHLEPVTHVENMRRSASPNVIARRRGRCLRGHPLAGDNVGRQKSGIYCKACHRDARTRRMASSGSVTAW